MNTEVVVKPSQSTVQAETRGMSFPARYARFGTFHLDLERQEVFRNGSRVRVPGKVYQVLVTLLERAGDIVSREALRTRLWPADTHVNFEANVNTTVNKLRQVLGDSNDQSIYVQTIPRRGYSFIAKGEFVEKVAPVQALVTKVEKRLGFLPRIEDSGLVGARNGNAWFTAGVIALVIAAILFGAAVTLYTHRAF